MLLTGWLTQLQNHVTPGRSKRRRRQISRNRNAPEVLELRTLLSAIGTDDSVVVVDSNLAPDAVSDTAETTAGVPVTVDVLTNDSDPDGDFLTIAAVGSANHGSVEVRPADGGLWDYYQFDQQYAGQDGDRFIPAHPDTFLLPKHVSYFFTGNTTADDEEMLRLLEPFRPHRFYVLALLLKGSPPPPRRGPRRRSIRDRFR